MASAAEVRDSGRHLRSLGRSDPLSSSSRICFVRRFSVTAVQRQRHGCRRLHADSWRDVNRGSRRCGSPTAARQQRHVFRLRRVVSWPGGMHGKLQRRRDSRLQSAIFSRGDNRRRRWRQGLHQGWLIIHCNLPP
ncbi:hypothetical protein PVAP13_3KG544766 [Panicum virgatum]|uniref:Uncharacterized protein n=1 Tax=Panicum virgatum TaxID=38727 RepID=A0A8T0VBQ6_PANVG|nr:hypothetical protein PVAP13_3KG544766 [Panicum virgatum]